MSNPTHLAKWDIIMNTGLLRHKNISRLLKRLVILTSRVLTGPYSTCSSKLYDNKFQNFLRGCIPTFTLDLSIHFYFIFLSHHFFDFLQIRWVSSQIHRWIQNDQITKRSCLHLDSCSQSVV